MDWERLTVLATLANVSYHVEVLHPLGSTDWGTVQNAIAGIPGIDPVVLDMIRSVDHVEVCAWYTNEYDLEGMLVANRRLKRFTLVFAGTDSMADWFTNLRTWKTVLPVETPAGTPEYNRELFVHSGFVRQLLDDGLQDRIAHDIGRLTDRFPGWDWEVCGHSLGGALAVLCSTLLAVRFPATQWSVTTFGAPRVGDRSFSVFVDSLPNLVHTRVTNGRDIVVCTPKSNYHHSGNSLWISNTGDVQYSEPPTTLLHSISDHYIDTYCLVLRKQSHPPAKL